MKLPDIFLYLTSYQKSIAGAEDSDDWSCDGCRASLEPLGSWWCSTAYPDLDICDGCYLGAGRLAQEAERVMDKLAASLVAEYATPAWMYVDCCWDKWKMFRGDGEAVCSPIYDGCRGPVYVNAQDREFLCEHHGRRLMASDNGWRHKFVRVEGFSFDMYRNQVARKDLVGMPDGRDSRSEIWAAPPCAGELSLPTVLQAEPWPERAERLTDGWIGNGWWSDIVSVNESSNTANLSRSLRTVRAWVLFDKTEGYVSEVDAGVFALVCCDSGSPLHGRVYTGVWDDHGRGAVNDSGLHADEYVRQKNAYDAKAADGQREQCHPHVKCDGCRLKLLSSRRWKCAVCKDYDLCDTCHSAGYEDARHQRSHAVQEEEDSPELPFVVFLRAQLGQRFYYG